MMYVWIVEVKVGKKWRPCEDAHLRKKDAERSKKYYWAYNLPNNEYRVTKYVPNKTIKEKE